MPGTQVVAPLEYTVFGDFLKYLRRRAQLTQAELAIACGYSTPHVSHLENNLRLPDQATLLALFVPALGLQDEPELVERLLALAAEARVRASAGGTAPQVAPAPGNLPPQPTPFVGRSAELARIAELLDNPACRLLTLIGPGGIGKTRLALQAAAEQAGRFAHGVFFVALAGLGAPEHLVAATAQAIGFVFRGLSSFAYGGDPPPDDPRIQLLDYLRLKSLLLVMDNFEHLRAGTELLSAVVQGAPSVKLLITSREPLALREEWLFQVEGLEVPDGDAARSPDDYSAVQLFVERARRTRLDFSLAEHTDAVIRLCKLLEGLPLGIELAASLLRAMPIDEIADEIAHDFDVLAAPQLNLPERHRSLRAMFEQSWGLLTEAERAALAGLAVFRGGFRRDAAASVAGADFRTLLALVNKSLVRLQATGRYDLHELLREFAEEKLRAMPGAWEAARDRHLAHFLDLAEQLEPLCVRAEQVEVMDRLESEHDNLRAALAWGHAKPDGAAPELRLAAALRVFWSLRRHSEEGARWLDGALERQHLVPAQLRARVLIARAEMAGNLGKVEAHRQFAEAALALCRELDDRRSLAWSLWQAGHAIIERRLPLLQEAVTVARDLGDKSVLAILLNSLGWRTSQQALWNEVPGSVALAEAIRYLEEALALTREAGNRHDAIQANNNLSSIWLALGEYARASAAAEAALALVREMGGNPKDVADCLNYKGEIARAQGDYALAKSIYEESLALYEQTDCMFAQVLALNLGCAEQGLGDYDQARTLFAQSLRWCVKADHKPLIACGLTAFAQLASVLGQFERAARLAGAAEALLAALQMGLDPADKPAYERHIAVARSRLGEAAFGAAYAEGHRMSLAEAAAYALEEGHPEGQAARAD